MTEVVLSNCKINLGLFIISKRDDGFHNIETIFYPVNIFDELHFSEAEEFQILSDSPIIPTDNSNLIWKAADIFYKYFKIQPEFKIFVKKRIPIFAGLGGGSSNAAATLNYFIKKYQIDVSLNELIKISSELGSDVPFFLINKPCFASGKGEILEPRENFIIDKKIVIIFPNIKISTPEAYKNSIPKLPDIKLSEIDNWEKFLINIDKIKNDFEPYVFSKYPEIKMITNKLKDLGAIYSSLSGSGSAVYGIFDNDYDTKQIYDNFNKYEVFIC